MKSPSPRIEPHGLWLAVVAGLILFGLVLRVFSLNEQGYWHDELYSVAHLSGFDAYLLPSSDLSAFEPPRRVGSWLEELERDRFWETLDRNLVHEGHPPLYQFGLKGWTSLFGRSIHAVRSFSLFPAVSTIGVLYLLGLCLRNAKLGTATALLAAISPFHLYYSLEARNYAWSLFFSSLALLAVILMWKQRGSVSRKWLTLWWLAVVASCYTHYYAGLYCAVLMILMLIFRRRTPSFAVKLVLPFFLFLPWLLVLEAQIGVHAEHWTTGAPGALEAGVGFLGVLLDQLTGVFVSATMVERLLAGIAMTVGVLLVARDQLTEELDYDERWVLLSVPAFGVAVLAVDLVTDHHTILISRYLISLLPCLLLICAWLATSDRVAYRLLFTFLVVGNLIGFLVTAAGERAPKQMVREVGAYIGNRYSVGDLVVVTPSGPTFLGLILQLPRDVLITAVPPDRAGDFARQFASSQGTVWLVRQNLGVAYEAPDAMFSVPSRELIRFAGIDLVPIMATHRP